MQSPAVTPDANAAIATCTLFVMIDGHHRTKQLRILDVSVAVLGALALRRRRGRASPGEERLRTAGSRNTAVPAIAAGPNISAASQQIGSADARISRGTSQRRSSTISRGDGAPAVQQIVRAGDEPVEVEHLVDLAPSTRS